MYTVLTLTLVWKSASYVIIINNNNTPCLLSVLNCTCTLTIIESCNNTVTIFLEALSLQTTTTETNIHYHTLKYFFKQHNKTTLFTQNYTHVAWKVVELFLNLANESDWRIDAGNEFQILAPEYEKLCLYISILGFGTTRSLWASERKEYLTFDWYVNIFLIYGGTRSCKHLYTRTALLWLNLFANGSHLSLTNSSAEGDT